MKKILLLGGSNCQKNALILGKKLGYEMIIADYVPHPAAANYAKNHVLVSTFDVDGCIRAAKKFGVDGVMTLGTDQPVLTVAHVANALRLPSMLSPGVAKTVTNKKLMKNIFQEYGIPTVPFQIIDSSVNVNDISGLSGPYVLKPFDSQGQRGVYKIDHKEKIPLFIQRTLSFSREKEVLLEEYYPSDEITVSGWIHDSKLSILTVTDRILFDDPIHIGICTSHRFPTVHMDQYDRIKEISEKIVNAFRLENGPLYIQMLVGNHGILVNEVAARIGGAFEDVIIPKITGFNILNAVIKASLGLEVDIDNLNDYHCERSKMKASVQLMFADPGVITQITPIEQLLRLPEVYDAGYNYKIGDEIKSIENATARFGHCVMISEQDSIQPAIKRFQECFRILDEKGKNLYKVL